MKFSIFGLSISSSWGNGHATLLRGLFRNLIQRRHKITFFEKNEEYYERHRDFDTLPGGNLIFYDEISEIKEKVKGELADTDIIIVTSYLKKISEIENLIFEYNDKLKIFYDLDSGITLENLKAKTKIPYLTENLFEFYDIVLTYTGGETFDEFKNILKAKEVYPLYGFVDPYVHKKVLKEKKYISDFSYIGTYAVDRQYKLKELFIKPAERMNLKFLLAGALYPNELKQNKKIIFYDNLPPREHAAFYSSSKMTLNITREGMAKVGYCPSGRLFEAAACETPIVSDYFKGIEEFFPPGSILIAEKKEDVENFLELSDFELMKISKNAYESVLEGHTALRRVLYLESLIEEKLNGGMNAGNNTCSRIWY